MRCSPTLPQPRKNAKPYGAIPWGAPTVARLLAKSLPDLSPDDAFLAGIFHDVGKLLLYDVVPEDYARLHADFLGGARVDEEKLVFGVTHEEIGLTSAHSWGLSKEVKTAIGFHHHATTSPIHAEYATLIHVANGLALFWGIGSQAGDAELDVEEGAIERLGLDGKFLASQQDLARRDVCRNDASDEGLSVTVSAVGRANHALVVVGCANELYRRWFAVSGDSRLSLRVKKSPLGVSPMPSTLAPKVPNCGPRASRPQRLRKTSRAGRPRSTSAPEVDGIGVSPRFPREPDANACRLISLRGRRNPSWRGCQQLKQSATLRL